MDLKKIKEEVWQLGAFKKELEQLPKTIRDFNQYYQDHFTEEEKKGYEEEISLAGSSSGIEKKVNDTYLEFMKIKVEDFDKKYLIPDHNKTKSFIKIAHITYVLNDFKKGYCKDDVNEFTEPEKVYIKVYEVLKNMDPEIVQVVLQEINASIKGYNIELYLNGGQKPEKWEFMKNSFLSLLENNDLKPKEEIVLKFEDFFEEEVKDPEGLKGFLKGIKGKDLAVAITLLQEKGFLPENFIRSDFYNSFNLNLNHSGVNKYLRKDKKNYSTIEVEDNQEHKNIIDIQIVRFL